MLEIRPVHASAARAFALGGKPVHGSQAILASGDFSLLMTSGQVAPSGPDGRGDIETQVHQVLRQLQDVVESAGAEMRHVVKLMAWLPRREHVPVYAEVRRQYFPDSSPASTSVIGELVEPDILIEVEAIALVPTGEEHS